MDQFTRMSRAYGYPSFCVRCGIGDQGTVCPGCRGAPEQFVVGGYHVRPAGILLPDADAFGIHAEGVEVAELTGPGWVEADVIAGQDQNQQFFAYRHLVIQHIATGAYLEQRWYPGGQVRVLTSGTLDWAPIDQARGFLERLTRTPIRNPQSGRPAYTLDDRLRFVAPYVRANPDITQKELANLIGDDDPTAVVDERTIRRWHSNDRWQMSWGEFKARSLRISVRFSPCTHCGAPVTLDRDDGGLLDATESPARRGHA